MRVCLGMCDKSNSGKEAVTLLFSKDRRESEGDRRGEMMLEEECKRNNKQYIFFWLFFSHPTLIQLLAHTHSHQLGKPYHFLNTHYPFVLSNNAASLRLRGRECIGAHTSCMLNAKVFSLCVSVWYTEVSWRTPHCFIGG